MDSEIEIDSINNKGYDFIGENLWSREMKNWDQYKGTMGFTVGGIILSGIFSIIYSKIQGIPVAAPTFESIGDAIGRTWTSKEESSTTTRKLVSLRYEKLFGYCEVCSRRCHREEKCPLGMKNIKKSPEQKREFREGNGGKHDDRARSNRGPARREEVRPGRQDGRTTSSPGPKRDQQNSRGSGVEAREEGEIGNAAECVTTLPSQNFQELSKTQADGT
ncbi:hypothetical protein F2Q69_00039567 [Brassica cretica]|uniref:Uncharacterized protein n=1 Tax=Brassica cretica TaxID=69181 RepID=A0A8S9N6X6_BRACR|nr:hypothetical protein F2Q69_00039567 [Brassica cretica]